jgi:hypothetical protein
MMKKYIMTMWIIVPLLMVTGCKRNSSPNIPSIPYGVSNGWVDSTYSFFTTTSDPDRDNICLKIEWGDGAVSEWSDFVSEGTTVYFSHNWHSPGSYSIRAKAKDIHNKESEWSGKHIVTISTKKTPPSIPVITNFPDTFYLYMHGYQFNIKVVSPGIDNEKVSCQLASRHLLSQQDEYSEYDWTGFKKDSIFTIPYAPRDTGHYVITVRARNESGGISDWSIPDTVIIPNRPPHKPTITGPPQGFTCTKYEFESEGSDSDMQYDRVEQKWILQKIAYSFDFGDGSISDFSMDMKQGEKYPLSHAYETGGTFEVRVQVRDSYKATSNWSEPHQIIIENLYENSFPAGILPTGIVTDGEYIYVADFEGNTIKKFNMSGEEAAEWSDFTSPRGVELDGDYLYLTEWDNHRVLKLNKITGARIDSFGKYGIADTSLKYPCDITIYSEYIYVTEYGNNRVHKFTKDGEHIDVYGREGNDTLSLEFMRPFGITHDDAGNLYVADSKNGRIRVLREDGVYVETLFGPGSEEGQVSGPQGVAWENGFLYVADTDNHRIQRFKIGMSGDWEFDTRWGMEGDSDGQFRRPHDIMVYNGKVYVVDTLNRRIQVFRIP